MKSANVILGHVEKIVREKISARLRNRAAERAVVRDKAESAAINFKGEIECVVRQELLRQKENWES